MVKTSPDFFTALESICGNNHVLTEPGDCWSYGYDNSRMHRLPVAVVMPENENEISSIIALCCQHNIAVTARGRGTNTAGGSIPEEHGIIISTDRMNRVIEYRPEDRFIRVQPGVINSQVQEITSADRLFWPPDPTSSDVCTIGGNLAMDSAGPRAVKYGPTHNHVTGLRAVTGTGEIISTGVVTSKGVVGYDITRLLIGSEGTLAFITEATLQLQPMAEASTTIRLLYRDIESATRAISAIMSQPVIPCGLEFMDEASISIVSEYSDISFPAGARALLMIEVEAQQQHLSDDAKKIVNVAGNDGLIESVYSDNKQESKKLWSMRKALSPALRKIAPNKINEDVVVPVSRIPELVSGLQGLSKKHGIPIVNFGHAGNGNIHVNLLFDSQDKKQLNSAEPCLREVFELVLHLQGTLSGEHGIGEVKRNYISSELDSGSLQLMHGLKHVFDPQGILNPGKALPETETGR